MSEQTPSSDRLRQMASDYERAVSGARSEQLVVRAMARAGTSRPLRRPRSALVIGFSVFLLMVVALGLTSASALPGDSLYGVSRAYEEVGGWVGVGDPVEQRLNEVIALAEKGDSVRAAQAATEALEALERTTDFTSDLAPVITLPNPEDSGGGSPTQETTSTTAPSSTSVEASPVGADDESVQTLKLAAELLLSRVQNNGGELNTAAAGLAKAIDDLVGGEDPVTVEDTSTTTTEPEDISTTTTFPDSTTTTEPEKAGDGKGPILIPPIP